MSNTARTLYFHWNWSTFEDNKKMNVVCVRGAGVRKFVHFIQ